MTLVRFNNKTANNGFNNFVDDFFATVPSFLREEFSTGKQLVPVNIRETETAYVLEVVAPGLEKENFQVHLDNNILTVEGKKEATAENKNEKLVRKEYRFQSFKRSFTIDEKIDAEQISAQYVNGVLTLNLPKKAEVKPQVKQISIQ